MDSEGDEHFCGMLLKRSRKMHFWNNRFCSINVDIGVLEWRKSKTDPTPNGYVDMTTAKLIITKGSNWTKSIDGALNHTDNFDGISTQYGNNCFVVIDESGIEHVFCAESDSCYDSWCKYINVFNKFGNYNNNFSVSGIKSRDEALEIAVDNSTQEAVKDIAIGIIGEISSKEEVSKSHTNEFHDEHVRDCEVGKYKERLILRVCVGSLRKLSKTLFNEGQKRIFFELKTGSFSRTTKALQVTLEKNTIWNETINLASHKSECLPLIISAFEDRSRTMLVGKNKAPPKLLGSTVVSWGHYAHEEFISFWAMVKSSVSGNDHEPLGEIKLSLQILSSLSDKSDNISKANGNIVNGSDIRSQQQHDRMNKSNNHISDSPGQKQKRRASEIGLVTVKSRNRDCNPKQFVCDSSSDSDDDDIDIGTANLGCLSRLLIQCFGHQNPNLSKKEQTYKLLNSVTNK